MLYVEQTGRVPGITRAYGLVNRARGPSNRLEMIVTS